MEVLETQWHNQITGCYSMHISFKCLKNKCGISEKFAKFINYTQVVRDKMGSRDLQWYP